MQERLPRFAIERVAGPATSYSRRGRKRWWPSVLDAARALSVPRSSRERAVTPGLFFVALPGAVASSLVPFVNAEVLLLGLALASPKAAPCSWS